MAAIFFTVSSFDNPVRLLLNFCNRSLLVIGFRVRYLLTASSVIPWGPSSPPVGVGVLVLEPPPVPTEDGAGDTRGFLEAGLPSSPVFPFLVALAGRFLALANKDKKKLANDQHRGCTRSVLTQLGDRGEGWGVGKGRQYSQGVPGRSWLSLLTAAAIVFAAPSTLAVGVDERLLDDVLEPLPDFFFLFLSPSQITNKFN